MKCVTKLFVVYLGLLFIKLQYALSFYLYILFTELFLMLFYLQILQLYIILLHFPLFTLRLAIHPPKSKILKYITYFQNPFPIRWIVPNCISPLENQILLSEKFRIRLWLKSIDDFSFFAKILLWLNGFGMAGADEAKVIFALFAVVETVLGVNFFLADVAGDAAEPMRHCIWCHRLKLHLLKFGTQNLFLIPNFTNDFDYHFSSFIQFMDTLFF